MVDLTALQGKVAEGDEVIIFGVPGLQVSDLAERIDTIPVSYTHLRRLNAGGGCHEFVIVNGTRLNGGSYEVDTKVIGEELVRGEA